MKITSRSSGSLLPKSWGVEIIGLDIVPWSTFGKWSVWEVRQAALELAPLSKHSGSKLLSSECFFSREQARVKKQPKGLL